MKVRTNMTKRDMANLPVAYDGKCPCGEKGANGDTRHTDGNRRYVLSQMSGTPPRLLAICPNHIGNYVDMGWEEVRVTRYESTKGK